MDPAPLDEPLPLSRLTVAPRIKCTQRRIYTTEEMVQDRERAGRWIAGPPTSTGCVGSVQLIPTSRRHRQDEDHPQIPENDKGESHQRQILFPWEKDLLLPREPHTVSQGSLTPVFQYASLGRPHHGWQLSYSPQGTWNKIRDHSRNNS